MTSKEIFLDKNDFVTSYTHVSDSERGATDCQKIAEIAQRNKPDVQ